MPAESLLVAETTAKLLSMSEQMVIFMKCPRN